MRQQQNNKAVHCPICLDDPKLPQKVKTLEAEVAQLKELVSTDALTGLKNFRYFSQALEREMERSRRGGVATSLLMIDLDFFKRVNDVYGHEVGNRALKQVADILIDSVRKLDLPCRYGGEEFAVILPGTAILPAKAVAERLREAIASKALVLEPGESPEGESEITLTASVGLDVFDSKRHQDDAKSFTQRVDALLYQAKEQGRNRVVIAQSESVKSTVSQDEKDALFSMFSDSQDSNSSGE